MARRLFFVDQVVRGRAELRGEDARHLTRVLRVEEGQRYEVSDYLSLYLAEVDTARKDLIGFRVLEQRTPAPPPVSIHLFAALIKFDHFEWMLEKAAELGVAEIVPVEAERSERGLEKAAGKRLQRWRRVLLESSQQCRRAILPRLHDPIRLPQALEIRNGLDYLLDERPGAPPMLDTLPQERSSADRVALLVGPEGGWAGHEHDSAAAAGWKPVSLGANVLRAETAAIAALAVINAAWLHSSR
jgi:16S rRNA (uracil1498-N3)-methyltransferase